MRFLLLFFLAFTSLVACGQNEPLASYEPKSAQEKNLKRVLLAFEDGVKNQDSQKIADLLHKTASVMVGRERQMLDKASYIKILPARLKDNPPVSLGKPKIKIDGAQAEVKIYVQRGSNNTLVVYDFIREGDTWFIQSWQY